MSDLIGNPEDRFSHDAAQYVHVGSSGYCSIHKAKLPKASRTYAPVICIPGSLGAGDSGDIVGPKCRDLTFDESRQCRRCAGVLISRHYQFMPYSYNKGEAQPVHLHSLISSCFVA